MTTARQTYHLHTHTDSAIAGLCWTNDNLDRGYPNEEADWPVRYRDFADMQQSTGLSHVGASGVVVEVWLDGELLCRTPCRHPAGADRPRFLAGRA